MILDTSAIVAILRGEEDADRFATALADGLNFGDCLAYALARDTGDRLLFKGDDFSSTDVASALEGP